MEKATMESFHPSAGLDKGDPRNLRALFERASQLSREHQLASVFVGVAGPEGDLLVRDFLDFVEAELRVEDVVFRLLRERAVLWLADLDLAGANGVLSRLEEDFSARFPTTVGLRVELGFHRVDAGGVPTAKDVLPQLFGPERQLVQTASAVERSGRAKP
jgi:hypothetical protein